MQCQQFKVTGKVQGVCYRANTQTQAQMLGITGYAVNLADGSVEVLACGEAAALDALERWLHHGPARASVDSVHASEANVPAPETFTTG